MDLPDRGITVEMASHAAWWIDGRGRLHEGHRALGKALERARWPWPALAKLLLMAPPMSWVAALIYRLIVRIRGHLPGTVPACDRAWEPEALRHAGRETGPDHILLPSR